MKTLIVANWKCNPITLKEAKLLFNSVKRGIGGSIKKAEVIICPPFIYLPVLSDSVLSRGAAGLVFGSQNCYWQTEGAFTGEISPLMLKDLGVEYVIIGHSERRALGETDAIINKKIKAAIGAKLKPILCIGETEKQRKEGKTFEVLKNQLQKDLEGIGNWKLGSIITERSERRGRSRLRTLEIGNLVVAYEPIWAIGTGKACQVSEAEEVNLLIKKMIKNCPILYGGSVKSDNAKDYIKKARFQGLLIGGASLDAKEFVKIIKLVN